jgi:hypothetical protein
MLKEWDCGRVDVFLLRTYRKQTFQGTEAEKTGISELQMTGISELQMTGISKMQMMGFSEGREQGGRWRGSQRQMVLAALI